jgi:hypothetical protein
MKKAVLLAVAVVLLAAAAFPQCQGNDCSEPSSFVARPSEATVIVPIRLPQEPASILEITSSVADPFAAGILHNNGSRGITGVRIGWAMIDKTGNLTTDQGQLIDIAWPRPLPNGAHTYIANQAAPRIGDNIVKVLFYVAQVDFVGGGSYTVDLERLKNIVPADNQLSPKPQSQLSTR